MIRVRTAALLALVAIAAPAAAAAPSPILPGYWESTNRILSPIPTKSMERRCLSPKDVEKFMMGPENRHYDCDYPLRSFVNGKIRLRGQCVSRKGNDKDKRHIQIEATGTYSPSAFHLEANVKTKLAGITISGRASTDARRIGDTCPPPQPKKKKK